MAIDDPQPTDSGFMQKIHDMVKNIHDWVQEQNKPVPDNIPTQDPNVEGVG